MEIIMKDKRKSVIRGSLNDIINHLTADFIRVHRGFIINTKHLQQIESTILMVNNEIIPIGKKYRQDILNKINFI